MRWEWEIWRRTVGNLAWVRERKITGVGRRTGEGLGSRPVRAIRVISDEWDRRWGCEEVERYMGGWTGRRR